MNLEKLLDKAKSGNITKKEVDQIVLYLQQNEHNYDVYTLLHIIGRSGYTEYENVVSNYLHYKDDPMVVKLTLQILCSFWNKTSIYLNEVKKFIRGVEWDNEGDVRLIAVSIAGEYLRNAKDIELLKSLVELFKNDNADQTLRESAYFALGRAFGKNWSELPPASRHFDLEKNIDIKVLIWALEQIL